MLAPGAEGDFLVLSDHAPVMAALRPGVVGDRGRGGQADQRFFVRGGFADVNAAGLILLAETAIPEGEFDAARLDQEIREHRGRPRRRARRAEAPVAGKARPAARAQGRDEGVKPGARGGGAARRGRAGASGAALRGRVGASGAALRGRAGAEARATKGRRYCGSNCTCCVMPTSRIEVFSASNCTSSPRMRLVLSALLGTQ